MLKTKKINALPKTDRKGLKGNYHHMALKVLIADPNTDFLKAAKANMLNSGFEVELANNGKDAQITFSKEKFFAVVINIDLQNYSAMQFLKFVKSNRATEKLILYNCSEEKLLELEIEKDSLLKMGVTEVLPNTPAPQDIKKILEGHQSLQDIVTNLPKKDGISEEQLVESQDAQYTSIHIDDFYSSKNVLFDVFIKLGSNKYLKILHTGDTFSKERLDKYKNEKNVSLLYILSSDRQKLIQWNNFVYQKLVSNNKVDASAKVNLARASTESLVEDLFVEGLRPQMVDQAKSLCQTTFQLVEKEKGLYKVLREMQTLDPNAYNHAFMVGLFCGMVAKQFDWKSQNIFETFAMASLLHDIGKVRFPKDMIGKNPSELSIEQQAIFRTHPQLSVDILESSPMISQAVKQIILQHHETSNGSGYPFGLKDSNLLVASKIMIFVNEFVDLITQEKISPLEGVRKILTDKEKCKRYNGQVLENFTKIFVDPDKLPKTNTVPSNSTLVQTKKLYE
jgi:response regulator RpfG family c-di-GMP phosphodiesterase